MLSAMRALRGSTGLRKASCASLFQPQSSRRRLSRMTSADGDGSWKWVPPSRRPPRKLVWVEEGDGMTLRPANEVKEDKKTDEEDPLEALDRFAWEAATSASPGEENERDGGLFSPHLKEDIDDAYARTRNRKQKQWTAKYGDVDSFRGFQIVEKEDYAPQELVDGLVANGAINPKIYNQKVDTHILVSAESSRQVISLSTILKKAIKSRRLQKHIVQDEEWVLFYLQYVFVHILTVETRERLDLDIHFDPELDDPAMQEAVGKKVLEDFADGKKRAKKKKKHWKYWRSLERPTWL